MAGNKPVQTVGIIGSGPSGATLASLLAIKGVDVTLFDDGRRPDLIVGESLIPAIVPVLRKLGLEERAAAICQHKPGVTFTLNASEKVVFCFQSLAEHGDADLRLQRPAPRVRSSCSTNGPMNWA